MHQELGSRKSKAFSSSSTTWRKSSSLIKMKKKTLTNTIIRNTHRLSKKKVILNSRTGSMNNLDWIQIHQVI